MVATASFLTPLAGLGLSGVLLRNGARKPARARVFLLQALKLWGISTAICAISAVALAWFLLPDGLPWRVVPIFVIIEVASVSLTELVARSEQARQRIGRFGAINAGLPFVRLAVLGCCMLNESLSIEYWLWAYAGSSALYMILLCWWTGVPSVFRKGGRGLEVRDGLPFAAAALSMRLQAEFNKPVLARQGFELAGNFSAAQRMVDLISLPLMAMQEALWPRLYAAGGTGSTHRVAILVLIAMSLSMGGVLWMLAPWLPHVLGRDFSEAANTLRWLAFLPAFQCCRNLINFRIIAEKRLQWTGYSFVAAALAGVAANVLAVPHLGIAGAVLAVYISESVVMAVQWLGLWIGADENG